MTKCSTCGKVIDKVPGWLQGVTVDFVCNNCPNRTAKNIAFVSLEAEVKPTVRADEDEDLDVEEVADPDAEDA